MPAGSTAAQATISSSVRRPRGAPAIPRRVSGGGGLPSSPSSPRQASVLQTPLVVGLTSLAYSPRSVAVVCVANASTWPIAEAAKRAKGTDDAPLQWAKRKHTRLGVGPEPRDRPAVRRPMKASCKCSQAKHSRAFLSRPTQNQDMGVSQPTPSSSRTRSV